MRAEFPSAGICAHLSAQAGHGASSPELNHGSVEYMSVFSESRGHTFDLLEGNQLHASWQWTLHECQGPLLRFPGPQFWSTNEIKLRSLYKNHTRRQLQNLHNIVGHKARAQNSSRWTAPKHNTNATVECGHGFMPRLPKVSHITFVGQRQCWK